MVEEQVKLVERLVDTFDLEFSLTIVLAPKVVQSSSLHSLLLNAVEHLNSNWKGLSFFVINCLR